FASRSLRTTLRPTGTAPGCQVATARPPMVPTFPATPLTTVWEPIERAGSGAGATVSVLAAGAEAEPPAPEAVTTTASVEPRSSGVVVYAACHAFAIGAQLSPLESKRCQR